MIIRKKHSLEENTK